MDYREVIHKNVENGFNVRDDLKQLTAEEIAKINSESAFPYAVCALNLEGDLNIGMMARTSILLGASRFIIYGRRKIDRRSLVGAQNYLPIDRIGGLDTDEAGNYVSFETGTFDRVMEQYNYLPIFVEQGGVPITEVDWRGISNLNTPCFVFGNESTGIPPEMMENKLVVSVPQIGVLRSFNVSATAAIVLWNYVSGVYAATLKA